MRDSDIFYIEFVDKKGNIIASSVNDIIIGSRDLAEFTEAMKKALKAVGK